MEVFPLIDVKVDASVTQLLDDVQIEVRTLKGLGMFPPEVQAEHQRRFLPNRISDTLNIEGIRVNPRLTRAVLDGLAISETDRYSEQEIRNVVAANDLIESEAKDQLPLSSSLVREIHRRVEDQLIDQAGAFREHDVQITGASHTPPPWPDVPDLIRVVSRQLEEHGTKVDPLVAAVWAHATVAKIHPFVDGNGRTARMVQDFLLLRAGLLPVGVPISRRREYYDALEAADRGDFSNVVGIVAAAELAALEKAKRIAQEPEEHASRIAQLAKAVSTKKRQTQYNQYDLWRRRMEDFITDLTNSLDDFNAASSDVELRWRPYDILSFEKWREVREVGWAQYTWAFNIDVEANGRLLHRFLFYAKRHWPGWVAAPDDSPRDQVGLFLTSVPDRDTRWDLNSRYSDRYVSFREAVFDAGGPVFYEDPAVRHRALPDGVALTTSTPPWEPSDARSSTEVVDLFIAQILTKLGLVDT